MVICCICYPLSLFPLVHNLIAYSLLKKHTIKSDILTHVVSLANILNKSCRKFSKNDKHTNNLSKIWLYKHRSCLLHIKPWESNYRDSRRKKQMLQVNCLASQEETNALSGIAFTSAKSATLISTNNSSETIFKNSGSLSSVKTATSHRIFQVPLENSGNRRKWSSKGKMCAMDAFSDA